jgi:hypothetical protein
VRENDGKGTLQTNSVTSEEGVTFYIKLCLMNNLVAYLSWNGINGGDCLLKTQDTAK